MSVIFDRTALALSISTSVLPYVWFELELELIQSHMAQKPVLRGEVGCACVAREVSVERGGMGERKALGWVGVGVKPIRACLCLWSQRPSLLWCSPAGAVQCTA